MNTVFDIRNNDPHHLMGKYKTPLIMYVLFK